MKPNVVCNTGPLIALSIIGCQRILEELYQPAGSPTFNDPQTGFAKRVRIKDAPRL